MKCVRLSAVAVLVLGLVACGDGGGGGGSSSPVGTYALVKDKGLMDAIEGMAAGESGGLPPQMVKEMVAMMTLTAELKADQTFQVKGTMGGQGDFTGTGTWKLSGKTLTLTTTHQNGEAKQTPDVQETVYDGSTIRLPKKGQEMPFEMVLKRQ